MYGSRKMNSLRTMTLEDCHGLLLLVLLRGGKRRQTHLVHLRREKDYAAQSSVYEMCSNVKHILTYVRTSKDSKHATVQDGKHVTVHMLRCTYVCHEKFENAFFQPGKIKN